MTRTRKSIMVLGLVLAALCSQAFVCSKYHSLVVAEHDFKTTVQAFQDVEQNEFTSGNIPQDVHIRLAQGVLIVAQGGQQLNTLLQQNASNQSVLAQIQLVNTAIQNLNTQGVLGIKNPNTRNTVTIALQAVQAILSNVATELNAPVGTVTPVQIQGAGQ